jgi:hypothetical protein
MEVWTTVIIIITIVDKVCRRSITDHVFRLSETLSTYFRRQATKRYALPVDVSFLAL